MCCEFEPYVVSVYKTSVPLQLHFSKIKDDNASEKKLTDVKASSSSSVSLWTGLFFWKSVLHDKNHGQDTI